MNLPRALTPYAPRAERQPLRRSPRWLEAAAELVIKSVALVAILSIGLILLFLAREALPLFTSPEVHAEVNPGALVAGRGGHVWQPVSEAPKYGILPLLAGSLKVTAVALALAVPLGVGAAIFVSEYASRRAREVIKPAIELLAGVPSVVVGFFALVVLADWTMWLFGPEHRLNALVAGIGLSFAICPVVFTVSEDALRAVPMSYRSAALALGSTPSQALLHVVLPAATPGIAAAVVLGFGRAVGETMIVVLASGNAALLDPILGHSARTLTATIAQELGEVVVGSAHYHVLFALGAILFVFTFGVNLLGERVVVRMRRKLRGQT